MDRNEHIDRIKHTLRRNAALRGVALRVERLRDAKYQQRLYQEAQIAHDILMALLDLLEESEDAEARTP